MLRKNAVSFGKDVMRSGVSSVSRTLTDNVAGAPIKKSIKRHFVGEGRQLVNTRLKHNKTSPTIKKRTSRRRNIGRKRHRDIFSSACPGRDAVLRHTRVGTQFNDIPGSDADSFIKSRNSKRAIKMCIHSPFRK